MQDLKSNLINLKAELLQTQKELKSIETTVNQLSSDILTLENEYAFSEKLQYILGILVQKSSDKVGLFGEYLSLGLNEIFPNKNYTLEFIFTKDSEGFYKGIDYQLSSNGNLIKDIEEREGSSLLACLSFFTLEAIVASGILESKLLVLDEPFSNLSPETWERLLPIINSACKEHDVQIIIISHHDDFDGNMIYL